MTNNKNFFNDELDDLFEGVSLDEASILAGGEIQPTQEEYEKELIDKLNNNEVEFTDEVIAEVKKVIREGGEVDQRITEFLRDKFEISNDEVEYSEPVSEDSQDTPNLFKENDYEDAGEVVNHIQDLANQLGGYVKKRNLDKKTEPEISDALTEKVDYLTNQLGIIRQTLDEQGQTIVAGIGQGGDGQSPGSGEVRLQKQDDVNMDGIQPGQTLCWDPDLYSGTGGWYACDGGGGGGGGGTIQPAVQGAVWGCKKVKDCADLYWGTKEEYEAWYADGALSDISVSTATLVKEEIRVINGCIALEYTPSSTSPGASTSDKWYAVGAVDCNDNIIDTEDIFTPGDSSVFGPQGYFLVYDDPSDCSELGEGCDPTQVEIHGCNPVLDAVDPLTNELRWGTEDDYNNWDPTETDADRLDIPVLDASGAAITNVKSITAVLFEGCDKTSMEGKYTIYYKESGSSVSKFAEIYDDTSNVTDKSVFIANAQCDTTVQPPDPQDQILGCLAADGCKEVSGEDPSGNANPVGNLYWGDGDQITSDVVTDESGNPITDCQKLLFAVSAKDIEYEILPDGTIDGVWEVSYLDFTGNIKQVVWEDVIDPATCENGFFIVSDNECLNPKDDVPDEGKGRPWPGIIVGCKEVDPTKVSGGDLMWGSEQDVIDGTGIPAQDSPASTGQPIVDCQKIIYVFSTDPVVNETDKIGIWSAIYKDFSGDYHIAYSPSNINDGENEGFFITADADTCLSDDPEVEIKWGIFTGCREPLVPGQLYWGKRSEYDAGTPGEEVSDNAANLIDQCKKVYRPFSDDGEVWLGIVVSNAAGLVGSLKLAVHRQDGTATNSPINGWYTLGDCLADDSEESCPIPDTVYAEPVGCREVGEPGTDLLWGPISAIDLNFTGTEVVDTDVTKILEVSTDDLCDNGYGIWNVVYLKLIGGSEVPQFATRSGFNPAAVLEDSETFYLDTSVVECLEDPDDIITGKPIFGEITGCRRTLESAGTTLHWGEDGTSIKDIVKDVDGNDVTDAKFIVSVLSFNADEATKFGDWFCIYKTGTGEYGVAVTYGQSPSEGYYLDPDNCDPDVCEGITYPGALLDCSRVNEAFDAGDLYWNNGDDTIANIDTGMKARRVIATLTVDDCSDPDFDISSDQEWIALYKNENDKFRVYGDNTGKSPMGGYYIEVDEVNSYCDYDTEGPGGICNDDDDCPLGFQCAGGICEQILCSVDDDCPEGFECVDGVCLRRCGGDDDALCPPNFHCITINDETWCVPGKECNGECPDGYFCLDGECIILECPLDPDPDKACPPGTTCVDGLCLKVCDSANICPPNFTCVDGHCRPNFGPCGTGCPPGYECVLGACRKECDPVDGSCPSGFQCFGGHCFPECPPEGCPTGHKCIGGICFPEVGCDTDGDCGGDFDCLNGICLPKCDPVDGSCPSGFECFEGTCVPQCNPDNPCPDGFHCLDNRCVPIRGCDPTNLCPTGYDCIDGFCRKECDDTLPEPCPSGFECFDLGDGTTHCFPKCDVDSCPPGHECIGGICIPPLNCNRPGGCPPGWDCSVDDGVCRPPCDDGQGNTDQCPGLGLECIDGHCWTKCDPTNLCPPGFTCIDGKCIPDLKCDIDTDCPSGFDCIGGICREECVADVDCPLGFQCLGDHCLPSCDETKDCPSGHACFNGICVPVTPCDDDVDCPTDHECVEGICLKNCTDDLDCPAGTMCVDDHCEIIGGPDGNCKIDADCPDGFECIDGKCRRVCDKPSACPPGYVCIAGNCLPGVPEGPCADGACPPGYDCFMGICRKPCVGGICDDGFECNDPPGACFPQVCDPTNPCPTGFECFEGRCRQLCSPTTPCEPGYNCVEITPGLTICLPITIDPPGPEQPSDNGPFPHPSVGCEEVDICGTLYWGSEEDYSNNTGELQIDSNGPIAVKKIIRVEVTNLYANGFGDYTVSYVPCDTPDEIHELTVNKQSPIDNKVNSFYIKPDNGATCIDFGDIHDPYPGSITGCKETDNGGTLHWGTVPEGLNSSLPNEPLLDSNGLQIICKGIMDVFSINSTPSSDGSVGQWGTWIIVYQSLAGDTKFTTQYGKSGPSGPEGAFMRAGVGSRCIDDPLAITTTREVVLVNSPRVMKTRSRFFGDEPMVATTMDPQFNTEDIQGPGNNVIRYETQEQANLMNLEILDLLDQRKPTVHVIPDINDVVGRYVPQRGDLWIDPTDYSIYVCDHKRTFVTPDDEQEFLDDPAGNLVWIELGAASGGGNTPVSDSSHIFLQGDEPVAAVVKHADIWIDDDTYLMYTYNEPSKSWVSLTGDVKAVLDNKFEVHVSDTRPETSETKPGDLWFDSGDAEMRVAYVPDGSTSWVWVPVQGTGYKSLPSTPFGADVGAAEVKVLQDEISRLSDRLYYLERNLDQQQ